LLPAGAHATRSWRWLSVNDPCKMQTCQNNRAKTRKSGC
jgi:hypothetical protein